MRAYYNNEIIWPIQCVIKPEVNIESYTLGEALKLFFKTKKYLQLWDMLFLTEFEWKIDLESF